MNHSLPCLTNKCILLPVCKTKLKIECENLTDYYADKTDRTYLSGHEIWDTIEKTLPKLSEIQGPMIHTKSLNYRAYTIYKDPGDRYPEFKQTPEEI